MLAHTLTTLRLLLALPVALAFAVPQNFPPWSALLCMLIAVITDVFDGKIARAQGTASAAGQLFDHGTDCLFVASALAGAAWAGLLTPILPPLVVFAFAQYVLDSRFLHKQKQLRMSSIGRWNGILYFVPPFVLALERISPDVIATPLLVFAYWCAWTLVLSTLTSIIDRALAR